MAIVGVAPLGDQLLSATQPFELVLVQAFIPDPAVEAFDKTVLHGLAPLSHMLARAAGQRDAMQCHSTFRSSCHLSMAFEVSSVPLSETIMQG